MEQVVIYRTSAAPRAPGDCEVVKSTKARGLRLLSGSPVIWGNQTLLQRRLVNVVCQPGCVLDLLFMVGPIELPALATFFASTTSPLT
jgi:hypothetical protein